MGDGRNWQPWVHGLGAVLVEVRWFDCSGFKKADGGDHGVVVTGDGNEFEFELKGIVWFAGLSFGEGQLERRKGDVGGGLVVEEKRSWRKMAGKLQ